MDKKTILVLPILLLLLVLTAVSSASASTAVNVIENAWALGIDESRGCPGDIESGWTHSDGMSLSRCYKNPAPPEGLTNGGAAFKCGPARSQGACPVGIEAWSRQEFSAQDRGVPLDSEYLVTYSHLQVCVGCDYVVADLYGSDDGGSTWASLVNVFSYPGDPIIDSSTLWPTYGGTAVTVPHYDLYRLEVRGQYSNRLGYKFTGVELLFEAGD